MIKQNPSVSLDRLTYIGAAAGIFFLWTVVEKQLIEPYGLYVYMPFYRVDGVCVWDILAAAAITAVFLLAARGEESS
jgi:hypothetical protein